MFFGKYIRTSCNSTFAEMGICIDKNCSQACQVQNFQTDTCAPLNSIFTQGNPDFHINIFCGVAKNLYIAHFTDSGCSNKNVYEQIKTEKCIPNTYDSKYSIFSTNLTHTKVQQGCLDSSCTIDCQETIVGKIFN
jgi:hypothetical protein